MDERMTAALATVSTAGKSAPFDELAYLEACTYLAEHRDQLPYRVFIDLPGGLSGNSDQRWAKVKELTEERCSCGNERTILPLNPRTEYVRSEAAAVVVAKDAKVYVKPLGGDKASTYLELEIIDTPKGPAFTFHQDPFGPFLLSASMFSSQGYMLSQLAEVLPKQTQPAVMFSGKEKTPLFAIEAADPVAGTLTIALDKDIETFDPSTWQDPHA